LSDHEKVGIVVVHGVGNNFEGWTDRHLVPELERWRAFESVDQLPDKGQSDELTLVIETARRYISVSVDSDDHFRRFCDVTGLSYNDSPKFKTRQARLENRDELIGYASQVLPFRAADVWLQSFRAGGVPCGIAFEPESEVHYVRDPESSNPTQTWKSFVRRWPLKDREVVMTELFWADLSKPRTTSLMRMIAILQLVMESPAVLGRAFVNGRDPGIHFLIRRLILLANWMMQRPIAGLNTAIFTAAFALLLIDGFFQGGAPPVRAQALAITIFASLFATAIAGILLFRRWEHDKIGLSDVALSTCLFSVFLIILAGAAPFVFPKMAALSSISPYLLLGLAILLAVWFAWTITIAIAVVLVTLVCIKRIMFGTSNGSPSMARAGASITLSVLLGMLWKFILSLAGVLIIVLLVPESLELSRACGLDKVPSYSQFFRVLANGKTPLTNECMLFYSNIVLVGIAIINLVSILFVLGATFLVMAVRGLMVRWAGERGQTGQLRLPRLIANWLIVTAAFLTALVNPVLIFGSHGIDIAALDQLQDHLFDFGTVFLSPFIGLIALIILYFVLNRMIDLSDSFVHIGRDLVDHQYNGVVRSLRPQIKPGVAALMPPDASPEKPAKRFRRRRRIQRRLEALIDEVIARQDVDRLIFVGHSQGSVILYDYLRNTDSLLRRDHLVTDALFAVQSIDILTLGSPLSHIYKHYFHDYSEPLQQATSPTLMSKANRWVNMWRVDDPIGHQVDLLDGIANICLPPGGHVDYWREDEVCQRIWEMIWRDDDPGSPARTG